MGCSDPYDYPMYRSPEVTKYCGEVKKGCQHGRFRTVVTCCGCGKVLRDETDRSGLGFGKDIIGGGW